jgi:Fe-S cluster assembly iron-binding protein IscA
MLTVTDSACALINDLLDRSEAPDDAAARLTVGDQGLQMTIDTQRDGDQSFDHEGKTVLLIDEQVASLLEDKSIDTQETEQGPVLAVTATEQ